MLPRVWAGWSFAVALVSFPVPKLQAVSMTQAGHVAQAAGNAVAFPGCSSGSFQAGTNCVGSRGVSEKHSGVGAGVPARGVAFQARSPGQTFQNPFTPTVSLHIPFRGCQSGCNGPTASQGIQHSCSLQPAPVSVHPAHACVQGLCRGLRHSPSGCLGWVPKGGRGWGRIAG